MRYKTKRIRERCSWVGGLAAAIALVGLVGCTTSEPPAPPAKSMERISVDALPASLPVTPTAPPVTIPEEPRGIVLSTESDVRRAWQDAVALVEGRDFEKALPLLEAVAGSRENDSGVVYVLGIAQWKTGRLDEAEASLARSVEIDEGRFKGWLNLARVRMDAGLHEGALEAARRAVALDASSADALHQSGRALYALGQVEEAVEVLETAVAFGPSGGHAANTLGWVLIRQGRYDEAVVPLEAAREALPGVSYVRNNLGMAYERTGRRADAVAEYRAAVEAGDDSGKAAASLARLGAPAESGELVATQQ